METNKLHSRLADDDDRKKIWLDLPYNSNLGKLDFEVRKNFNKENKTLF